LLNLKVRELIILDSKGVIYKGRQKLDKYKNELAKTTNKNRVKGGLKEALPGADVFIGVSVANILKPELIKSMNNSPIVFAMANPVPEIMPDQAIMAGAAIVATGRSDFPNQINNVLAFPGVFRGALDAKAEFINEEMKLAAVTALTDYLKHPTSEKIIPSPLDKQLVVKIAEAVAKSYNLQIHKRLEE
jgi:malate dehydrogenase (oxaloacetate-decarboxylating)